MKITLWPFRISWSHNGMGTFSVSPDLWEGKPSATSGTAIKAIIVGQRWDMWDALHWWTHLVGPNTSWVFIMARFILPSTQYSYWYRLLTLDNKRSDFAPWYNMVSIQVWCLTRHCIHKRYSCWCPALRRRHNGCDVVSNHQPCDCLLNRFVYSGADQRKFQGYAPLPL